jgi:hypothetical protein
MNASEGAFGVNLEHPVVFLTPRIQCIELSGRRPHAAKSGRRRSSTTEAAKVEEIRIGWSTDRHNAARRPTSLTAGPTTFLVTNES